MESAMALFTIPFKENRAEWLKDSRKREERRGKRYLESLSAKQSLGNLAILTFTHTKKAS